MKQPITRRWLIFFIISAMFFLSQFYRVSVAVISPNLIQEMGLGALELSTISAAFFYAFALMQIPVGIFLDSIGPRISMITLTLVAVIGAVLFSHGESAGWLTLGRALLGIGMACNFMGTLKLITIWFDAKQFATLSAFVVSIGTLGNIAAATPLVLMVQAIGWRKSFLVLAVITLLLVLLFSIIVKDQPDQAVSSRETPDNHPSVKETLAQAKELFRQRDFWIISVATFCRYGIFAAVQALWAGPFLMTVIGLTPVAAGNILFLMSIGLIVGCPLWGHLSDNYFNSRKTIIIAGIWGMVIILALLAVLAKGAGAFIFAILFFFFGLFSGAGQVMYAHIKEQVPHKNAGMAMTGINFFTMAGVAIFLQGLGSIMKMLYPETSLGVEAFRDAFIFCGVCLIIIALLYGLTSETLTKKTKRPSS